MDHEDAEPDRKRPADWVVTLLLAEGVALLIALVTPITPSKTGSTWSPADLFVTDPNYLEKVIASFVAVNVLIAVLGLVVSASIRRDRSK